MSQITETGWVSQDVASIIAELKTSFEQTYGTDFPTTPDSGVGQLISIFAEREKKLQDLGQAITDTQNLSTAEGIYLDYIAEHKGTARLREAGSRGYVCIKGRQNTTIAANTPYKDELDRIVLTEEELTLNKGSCYSASFSINDVQDNTEYLIVLEGKDYSYTSTVSTTEELILQGLKTAFDADSSLYECIVEDSQITVNNLSENNSLSFNNSPNVTLESVGGVVISEAVTKGALVFGAGSITKTVLTSLDIFSVTNPSAFTAGRYEENDAELRARLETLDEVTGTATKPAIQAALTSVDGVTNVLILDNKTDETDSRGIPAGNIAAYVVGGLDQEIGEKLYEVQPAGIDTYGDITVNFEDANGDPQYARFSRKGSKVGWLQIRYKINTEEDFPSDGEEAMSQAVISKGNSMYSGEDFVANKFYAPLYTISGVEVQSIEIAVTDSITDTPVYSTATIPISVIESLAFSSESVDIATA